MPIALIIVLLAAIGFYAYGKLRKELAKLEAEDAKKAQLAKDQKRANQQSKSDTLRKDPKTGVYRLDDD